jgi:predicted nucleotide-binding protein
MNRKQAIQLIHKCGLEISEQRTISNGYGTQLRTSAGPILDVYNTGKWVLGGKHTDALQRCLKDYERKPGEKLSPRDERLTRLQEDNADLNQRLRDRDFVIEAMKEYVAVPGQQFSSVRIEGSPRVLLDLPKIIRRRRWG